MPASAAGRSSTLHVPGQPDQQLQAPLLNITVNNVAGNIYYQGRTFNVSQLQDMGTCTPQQRSLVDTPLHVAVRHLCDYTQNLADTLFFATAQSMEREATLKFISR